MVPLSPAPRFFRRLLSDYNQAMAWILLIVAGTLLAGAAGVCAWLAAERRSLVHQRDQARQDNAGLQETAQQWRTRAEVAEQTRQHDEQAEKRLSEKFENLANHALKQNNEQFMQMAKRNLEGEKKDADHQLEQRKQQIESLVKPVRESLDKHRETVQSLEKQREGAYQGLRQQISDMQELEKELRGQTQNLVKALRRPEVRGQWGELHLKRVAEMAGLVEARDYDLQASVTGSDGEMLRPDMTVRLPSERSIVVDAGSQLDAYFTALECQDGEEQAQHLERHVKQIEKKISDLSSKRYQDQFARSPDFVVLFINLESSLQAAVGRKPTLMEEAMNQGIVIATPSTLVALLKTVALGWREERIAENAQRIQREGAELHKRLCTALGHLDGLGKAVGRTVKHYNDFVGSFESQVLVQAQRFEDLGTDSQKDLPDSLSSVDQTPRDLRKGDSSGE